MPQTKAHERAQAFRQRATDLIWVAESLSHSKGRAILLDAAADYHRMAATTVGAELIGPVLEEWVGSGPKWFDR